MGLPKRQNADYILCGDIHLREKVPIARTDDFEAAQWKKLKFIAELQRQHDCPVLCSGDLFHYWKPSPELLTKTMQHLPKQFFTIYGDHDLPQHSWEQLHKSGLTTLEAAGKLTVMNGGHGTNKNKTKLKNAKHSMAFKYDYSKFKERKVFVWHVLTWKTELPFPGCTNKPAKQLLKKNPQFDLIVTGDNHKPFTEKYKGRLLVNVGSMMRNSADQVDYRPAVWLYYAKENEVQKVYLPIEKEVVSRAHIEDKQRHNDRIDAFVGALHSEFKVSLDLTKSLEEFFDKNKTKKKIKQIILNHTD